MIKVQLKNGKTIDVDLNNNDNVSKLKVKLKNPFFHRNISAIQIFNKKKVLNILKRPSNSNNCYWSFGKIGEATISYDKNISKTRDIGEVVSVKVDGKYIITMKYFYSNNMVVIDSKILI